MKLTTRALRAVVADVMKEARFGRQDRYQDARDARADRMRNVKGTIFLPTTSAIALWKGMILGQMSDGAWENSGPEDHWIFWHHLKVEQGHPHFVADRSPLKQGYNLASLIEYVGDEMLKIGRMGKAGHPDENLVHHGGANYMPDTLDQFLSVSMGEKVPGVADYAASKIKEVPDNAAEDYYATDYTMRDLKRDLALIKRAMKSSAPEVDVHKSFGEPTPHKGPIFNEPSHGSFRHFVFQEGSSNKFWSIKRDNKTVSVKWGRIGSRGQEQTKTFGSDGEAREFAENMVQSKIDKGYRETGEDELNDLTSR